MSHARGLVCGSILAGAAVLLTGGCTKTVDTVKVQKDGSGTYVEDVSLDAAAAARLQDRMAKLREAFGGRGMPGGPPAGGPPAPAMDGDKPAEPPKPDDPLAKMKDGLKAIEGLEIGKAEAGEKDGKKSLHVEGSFKTLEAYAKASFISMGGELKKNDDGSYTLTFGGGPGRRRPMEKPPGGDASMGEPGMDDPAMGDAAMGDAGMGESGGPMGGRGGGLGMMLGALGPDGEKDLEGFEITRTMTLPGPIVSTNGTKGDDGATVTWKIDLAWLKDPKDHTQTVTFKGEGLDLKPFQLRRRPMGDAPGRGPPGGMPGGAPGGEAPPTK